MRSHWNGNPLILRNNSISSWGLSISLQHLCGRINDVWKRRLCFGRNDCPQYVSTEVQSRSLRWLYLCYCCVLWKSDLDYPVPLLFPISSGFVYVSSCISPCFNNTSGKQASHPLTIFDLNEPTPTWTHQPSQEMWRNTTRAQTKTSCNLNVWIFLVQHSQYIFFNRIPKHHILLVCYCSGKGCVTLH